MGLSLDASYQELTAQIHVRLYQLEQPVDMVYNRLHLAFFRLLQIGVAGLSLVVGPQPIATGRTGRFLPQHHTPPQLHRTEPLAHHHRQTVHAEVRIRFSSAWESFQ